MDKRFSKDGESNKIATMRKFGNIGFSTKPISFKIWIRLSQQDIE